MPMKEFIGDGKIKLKQFNMPYYQYLRNANTAERELAVAGLLRLKDALAAQIPKKTTAENLLIAIK